MEASFTLLGTKLHTFWPTYLERVLSNGDCTLLNLGIVKSLLRNLYLIAGCSHRVIMYVGLDRAHVVFNFIHENSYVL